MRCSTRMLSKYWWNQLIQTNSLVTNHVQEITKWLRGYSHTPSMTPTVIFLLSYLNFHSDAPIAICSFLSTPPSILGMFSNTIQPTTVTVYLSPPIYRFDSLHKSVKHNYCVILPVSFMCLSHVNWWYDGFPLIQAVCSTFSFLNCAVAWQHHHIIFVFLHAYYLWVHYYLNSYILTFLSMHACYLWNHLF